MGIYKIVAKKKRLYPAAQNATHPGVKSVEVFNDDY